MKVKNADEFYKILERKAIYPVFQPIVNLQTGDVAGYEALSRIDRHDTTLMISDLFVIAEQVSGQPPEDGRYTCGQGSPGCRGYPRAEGLGR